MVALVHLTPEAGVRQMARSGVAARSRNFFGERGVYAMPVLPSYTLTHSWTRELRRWKNSPLAAVHLRLPDDEPVTVGHYGREPQRRTAAEAVALIRALPDPRGHQIFVPRRVAAGEVRRVRRVGQHIGWRYRPDAHGRIPCPCCVAPGTPGVAKIRRQRPMAPPLPGKPELMATLRAATTSDDIIDALYGLGARSRGGAEELAYLVDHPDPEVREVLDEVLANYRGAAARELQARIVLD